MKKIVLLLFIALLSIVAVAQNVIPIPVDSTSVWRISRQHNDESCVYHYSSIYYIDGTTTIGGKEYSKVYEEGYHWCSSVNPQYPCTCSSYYQGIFVGGIRTENGKVYGYRPYESPGLFMDFTLNVGDTLFSNICYYGKIIESIDSVMVGTEYRTRFNFEDDYSYCGWMIEGVGHQQGLFESMDEPFESTSHLICYGENYVPIFGNMDCDITVGQEEIEQRGLSIYPNPSNTIVVIDFGKSINQKEIVVKVMDQMGKVMFEKCLKKNSTQLSISVQDWASGMYIATATIDNGDTGSRKFVVR